MRFATLIQDCISKLTPSPITYIVRFSENSLDLYRNNLFSSYKLRRKIPTETIEAVYATSSEHGFYFEIFLKDNKRMLLSEPAPVYLVVSNWQEFVGLLPQFLESFNTNNLDVAKSVEDIPVLCWHFGRVVEDLKLAYNSYYRYFVWKKTSEEYDIDEYNSLLDKSKNIY